MKFDATKIEDELERFQNGPPAYYKPAPMTEKERSDFIEAYKKMISTPIIYPMNTPPGNPTETDPTLSSERRSDPELKRLEDLVLEDNEAIKTQQHIKWLADVEISRRKRSLKATLASIETITKGPES